MDNLIGAKVVHSTYGKGIVIEQKNDLIKVNFSYKNLTFDFKYPCNNNQYIVYKKTETYNSELSENISLEKKITLELSKSSPGMRINLDSLLKKLDIKNSDFKLEDVKEELKQLNKSFLVSGNFLQIITFNKQENKITNNKDNENYQEKLITTSSTKNEEEEDQVVYDDAYNYKKSNFWSYITALDREKEYVKKMGGKKCHLENGILVSEEVNGYHYSFEKDDDQYYPDDGQIRILDVPFELAWGTIISSDENIVNIKTQIKLDDTSDGISIDFMLSTYAIIENLCAHIRNIIKKVEEEDPKKNKILYKLLHGYAKKDKYFGEGELVTGQSKAISRALKNDILFIWGPPGTGKTYTLSKIAIEHIKQGHKVLMVSNSNVAVDGAALKVKKDANGNFPLGTILRYGYPHMPELVNDEEITSYCVAASLNKDILNELKSLYEEKENYTKKQKGYIEIVTEIKKLRKKLKEKEKELVLNAKFVCSFIVFPNQKLVIRFK